MPGSVRRAGSQVRLLRVLGLALRSWPRDLRRRHGPEVVDLVVASVRSAPRRWRWARALWEAAGLVVAGPRIRMARASGGTIAGGWIVSIQWAVAALLCWATVDLGLLLARNAARFGELPNLLAIAACVFAGVAVRRLLRGGVLLPLHIAAFLVVTRALRAGVVTGGVEWRWLIASPQAIAVVLLGSLVVQSRRHPARSALDWRWSWLAPGALLVAVVQAGRGMPLTDTPPLVVAAAAVTLLVVCLVEPRAAVTVTALMSVGILQGLLFGSDPSTSLAVATGTVLLPVTAAWNLRQACRS